jgi:hypothetical protein
MEEKRMFVRTLIVIVLLASPFPALGQDEANKPNTNSQPGYREGDYIIHDYKSVNGASLPEVKSHYRTVTWHNRMRLSAEKRPSAMTDEASPIRDHGSLDSVLSAI